MTAEAPRHRRIRRLLRPCLLLPTLLVLASLGCSGAKGLQKQETIEEGPMAARREAEAAVQAQVAAGDTGLQGTSSTIPSLVPGEGRVVLPAAEAPPATAPDEKDFDNDNPGHLLSRCRDRSARSQWFDAIGDCRRSYDLNPANVEPQVELMRLLINLQSYADAEESARKVLAARPNDALAYYYLAWSYRGREQFPRAIAALQKAIALDPKRAEFVQALGLTYCMSDDYGRGIATLEKAQAMLPGDQRTANMISSAKAVLAEKLEPYQKLVREKPDYFDNHAALGFMYQKYGLPQKALTSYDTALAMIPTPLAQQDDETKKIAAQIYYNRGVVYRSLGRPELGEPALWQAMQVDPELGAVGWYYIGLCRYDLGKFEPSIDALRKSIDLAPDVADNRAALADAYDKAGQAAKAREQRNAVLAIEARASEAKAAIAREERGESAEPPAAATPAPLPPEEPAGSAPAAVVPAAPAAAAAPPPAVIAIEEPSPVEDDGTKAE
ncbi:MAG: tetratricopeptide repeat protein [Candidatus Binatia bacterium]